MKKKYSSASLAVNRLLWAWRVLGDSAKKNKQLNPMSGPTIQKENADGFIREKRK